MRSALEKMDRNQICYMWLSVKESDLNLIWLLSGYETTKRTDKIGTDNTSYNTTNNRKDHLKWLKRNMTVTPQKKN